MILFISYLFILSPSRSPHTLVKHARSLILIGRLWRPSPDYTRTTEVAMDATHPPKPEYAKTLGPSAPTLGEQVDPPSAG